MLCYLCLSFMIVKDTQLILFIVMLPFDVLQVSTFADMEGDETFDSSFLGYADEVVEERIADDDVIMIKGTKTTSGVCN